MTIKLRHIGKWDRLPEGQALGLPGLPEEKRWIKIDVNTTTRTKVSAVQGEDVTFLAMVNGLQTLEFVAEGYVEVSFEPDIPDGEVWLATDTGEPIAFENPEAVSFTKIAGRRTRNPELELMIWKSEQRMNARLESQRAEYEAMLAAQGRPDPETGEFFDGAAQDRSNDAAGSEGSEQGADGPADAVADEKPGEAAAEPAPAPAGTGGTGTAK